MAKNAFEARQSQAIPYNLRANREARPGDFIQTEQGPVLIQVERRLQNIILENGFEHSAEAEKELDIIKARIQHLRAEYLKRVAAQKAKTKVTIASDDGNDLLVEAMAEYINTGDITSIVPTGKFASNEERDVWRRFTMADITRVNGRTIHATKTSNGKPLGFVVAEKGVEAKPGKAAILDNGEIIVAVLPLGKDAELLSKTFNSLYRG